MKKTTRVLSLLLVLCMIISVFAGCSSSSTSSTASTASTATTSSASSSASSESGTTSTATTTSGDEYTITMAFLGSEQTNQDAVYAKVSELCEKEIGMKFEPLMLSFGDYQDKLNLMLSGGDKLDILPMTSSMASSYINAKQIADLSQYIDEYGKDIISQMGETVAKSGAVNGFIYGIPSNKESASKAGIVMRKDIVDELGIDVDSLKTLDDLTAVFAKVKAAHPELDVVSGTNMVSQIQEWDPLTDSFGVLMDEGQSTKVVNLFETDLYKTRVNRVFNWYQAGYVKLDAATTTDTSSNLVKAGSLFSYFAPIKPGYLTQASASDGREMVYAYIGKDDGTVSNMIGSANVNFFDWGIAQQSEDKVKAMQFLDFAYSSADFNNLMNFGIEGEDYEKVSGSNVLIDYPSGKDATSVYHLNMGWHLPNQFVGYVWNGNPEDIWQQYKDFNASATYSKAFGFFYDSSTVSTQVTALSSVLTEYQKPLETGSVSDVESTLKDLNDKLYAAGLQEVMDLKQTQLDKWLSENTSK